jgi:hypothetical protein
MAIGDVGTKTTKKRSNKMARPEKFKFDKHWAVRERNKGRSWEDIAKDIKCPKTGDSITSWALWAKLRKMGAKQRRRDEYYFEGEE